LVEQALLACPDAFSGSRRIALGLDTSKKNARSTRPAGLLDQRGYSTSVYIEGIG